MTRELFRKLQHQSGGTGGRDVKVLEREKISDVVGKEP